MIEFFCNYCGLLLKFRIARLKLDHFKYQCPMCQTECASDIRLEAKRVAEIRREKEEVE